MRLRRRATLAALLSAPLAVACDRGSVPRGRQGAALWYSYGGRNREVLERLVARFNRSQGRFHVHAVYQGDYFEALAKLRVAMAAGAGPTFSHVIGEVVPYLFGANVLERLGEYPGADALDILPALGQSGTWSGGADHPLVALPFNRSTPIAYVNGALFQKHGVKPPRTWSELRDVARALTVRDGDRVTRTGFGCPIGWWFWVALLGQAGGSVVDSDGAVTLGGRAGERALDFWRTLIEVDRTMKPPPGRDYNAWEATNQDFLAGRTAMIWTSTAFLKYLEDNARFPVVAAPLPSEDRAAVPTGGTHFVVLRGAPDAEKEAAWAFLRWMLGTPQVVEWATSTGYMPVTRAAVDHLTSTGYYDRQPNDRVAVDQLAVAMPWPWSTRLFRIQREVVQPRLESAILERRDPRAVLDEARRLAREMG